jgi:HD-like signal output (HDOD) protein
MNEPTTMAASIDDSRLVPDLKIPPCPAVLADFAAEAGRDEPDVRRLVSLIGRDAGLAAAIIKAVNSPLYGLRTKATDVAQALSLMGLQAATRLLTGLILRQAFPASSGALMQRYWDDSTRVADTAAWIARRLKSVRRDEVHTFALFRNCGQAVMIARFEDYGPIVEAHAVAPGPALLAEEDARYRFNHARVGYALARGWLLPEPLCRAILCHHQVAQVASRTGDAAMASQPLVAIGLLAEQVASLRSGGSITGEWSAHESFVLETLGLSPEDVVAMIQEDLHTQE